MTSKPLPGRRTRSQIKLSDDILKVPEHSPMKTARNAVHKSSEPPSDMNSLVESEDELLLSPNKGNTLQRSKRSVSPPPNDGYNSGVSGERSGRESKRMKWDSGGEGAKNPVRARLTKAGHARTNSEPNPGPSRKAPRKRAGTTSSNKKPNSMSHIPASPIVQSPTGVPGKTRAQSVPLFPSFSSLPHLDLRKPPSSPTRARSPCSTDKYHGLKVYPSPPKPSTSGQQPLHVEAFSDDPRVRMEVDEECSVRPVVDTGTAIESTDNDMVPAPEVSIQRSRSPSPPVPTFVPPVDPPIIPATPMPSEPNLAISMSPLTPLPVTPLPTKFATGEDGNRYNASDGWGFNLEKGPDADSPLKPISQPDFGNAKNALAAPSVTDTAPGSQILRPSMGSPSLPLPAPALTVAEKSKRASLKAAPHKGPGPSSKGVNAFSFLMQNAAKQHASKSQDKAKGKGASLPPQAPGAGATNAKGKGKLGLESKKPSLKDRMRRKEKQEPAAPTKFVPVIFHEDEDEEEQVESEEQESKAETTSVPELVIPEPEGKPPLSEGVSQGKLGEPLPTLPDESLAIEVLTTQKLEGEPLPENEVVTESIPQPQPSSPGASPPEEPVGLTTGIEESTPLIPVISEAPVVQEQHDRPASPLMIVEPTATDVIQAEVKVSAIVDAPIGQAAGEPVLAPQTTDRSVGQLVEPFKPKPAPRKRGRSNIPTSTRVTRSTMKRPVPPVAKPAAARRATRIAGPARRGSISAQSGGKSGISSEAEAQQLSLGSPMQTSSPLQTPSRRYRTPGSSPAKISLAKTPSKPIFTEGSPSPMKIARAVSMFSRPSDVFAVDDVQVSLGGSSLSTLSSALEKLKMPAPSRPNTSLGFNHATGEGDDDEGLLVSTQLAEPEQGGSNLQRNGSRRRSMSIGHGVPGGLSKNPIPTGSSSIQAGPSTTKTRLIQKSMTSFFSKPDSSSMSTPNPRSAKNQLLGNSKTMLSSAGAKGNLRGLSGVAVLGNGGGKLFPMANKRLVQKVSKKSSLPMVEASPIKGGSGVGEVVDDSIPVYGFIATDAAGPSEKEGTTSGDLDDVFMVPLAKGDDDEMQMVGGSSSGKKPEDKGKEKEKGKDKLRKADSSRRASLALSQLSQSLSAAPAYGIGDKRSMGPPATPRKIARSVSSSYPAPSNVTSSTTTIATITATTSSAASSKSNVSPDKVPTPTGTRSSARQAAKADANADSSSPALSTGLGGSGKKDSAEKKVKGAAAPANKAESLKILNNCVIFVDVRADDGEEAGSLFVEMLEGLGAKILSRVGQTCTHVIFKNGLMSTISRWRLLRDPKPSVVGIAWVVDCVEQRRHVEEAPYLINLKEINVAGTYKRRRSMLPKLISGGMVEPTTTDVEGEEGEADVSIESTSSITLDDDLTPLERARRRRSIIFGPPA